MNNILTVRSLSTIIFVIVILLLSMADAATLGQSDYPLEKRKLLISDIRSASEAERQLLLDLSTDCDWPMDVSAYLRTSFDEFALECQSELKRYRIEFIQVQP